MKLLITCFLIMISCLSLGETNLRNGMGLSEANIIYTYKNILHILREFKLLNEYHLSKEEVNILKIYTEEARQEIETKLIFLSSNEFPFENQIFYARPVRRSSIYINKDDLYNYDEQGNKIPFSISDAVIIALKMNHRNKPISIVVSDHLHTKIAEVLNQQFNQYSLESFSRKELRIILKLDGKNNTNSKVLLSDHSGIFDITGRLSSKLYCPSDYQSNSIIIKNLHTKLIIPSDFENTKQKVTFIGEISYSCNSYNDSLNFNAKVKLFIIYDLYNSEDNNIDERWWFNPNVYALIDKNNINISFENIHNMRSDL